MSQNSLITMLIVCDQAVTGVTDDKGQTWTKRRSYTQSGLTVELWTAVAADTYSSTNTLTATVTFSGTGHHDCFVYWDNANSIGGNPARRKGIVNLAVDAASSGNVAIGQVNGRVSDDVWALVIFNAVGGFIGDPAPGWYGGGGGGGGSSNYVTSSGTNWEAHVEVFSVTATGTPGAWSPSIGSHAHIAFVYTFGDPHHALAA